MKWSAIFALLATTIGDAEAATGSFSYAQNGLDWKNDNPACGLTNQSPIDLSTAANAYKRYPSAGDMFTKSYSNQK